jgi:hypothetical protein
MAEIRREQTEVVNSEPLREEVVTTTDPVTGEVVNVNRTTGEVVTEPGVTQTVYRRTTEGVVPAVPAIEAPAVTQQEVSHVTEDPYAVRRMQVYKIEQVIYLIFGVLEALIAIRFVLRLLAANPNAGFAAFIYGITAPFIAPFVGLFGTPQYAGSVLELHSIVAIIVYALIAWLLARLVWLAAGETRTGVRSSTEQIDRRIR